MYDSVRGPGVKKEYRQHVGSVYSYSYCMHTYRDSQYCLHAYVETGDVMHQANTVSIVYEYAVRCNAQVRVISKIARYIIQYVPPSAW